jgi:hypothetical protein
MLDRLPCGCTGSKSLLHLTLHHWLVYGIVLVVALLLTWQLPTALAAAMGAWLVARITP